MQTVIGGFLLRERVKTVEVYAKTSQWLSDLILEMAVLDLI